MFLSAYLDMTYPFEDLFHFVYNRWLSRLGLRIVVLSVKYCNHYSQIWSVRKIWKGFLSQVTKKWEIEYQMYQYTLSQQQPIVSCPNSLKFSRMEYFLTIVQKCKYKRE